MRRTIAMTVGLIALSAGLPAEAQAKRGYCRSGDPDVRELIGWPMKCPGVRKVLRRWQGLDRCGVQYDAGQRRCSFRVRGGRHRWRCASEWIDTHENRHGVLYGEFEVNCWVPGLVKPHERWVDFTVFD